MPYATRHSGIPLEVPLPAITSAKKRCKCKHAPAPKQRSTPKGKLCRETSAAAEPTLADASQLTSQQHPSPADVLSVHDSNIARPASPSLPLPCTTGNSLGSRALSSEARFKPKRRVNRRSTTAKPFALESETELERRGAEFVSRNLLSQSTLQDYSSALKRVQVWLERAKEDSAQYTDGLTMLGPNSALVCQRWLEHHVDRDCVSFASISLTHAAFVSHFHNHFGCSKDRAAGWQWRSERDWHGNPAYAPRYLDLLDSARRKDGRLRKRVKRSLPMLYPTLAKVLLSIEEQLKEFDATPMRLSPQRTRLEFMHAFMIISYRLWTRCDETCQMEWGDIDCNVGYTVETQEPYRAITLTFRKTNQMDPTKANCYHLPKLHARPLVDVLHAIPRWQKYWEFAAQRPPQEHDLLFPSMYSTTGQLRPSQKLRNSDINTFLKQTEVLSTEAASFFGTYTTHCFRRGGLQDCMIHAHKYNEDPWPIAAVKWWGGWSPHESQDILLRYLFEEVQKTEVWYGDMQTPRSVFPRTESLLGGTSTVYTKAMEQVHLDFVEMQDQLNKQTVALAELSKALAATTSPPVAAEAEWVQALVKALTEPASARNAPADSTQTYSKKQQEQDLHSQQIQHHKALVQHQQHQALPAVDLSGPCVVGQDNALLPQHIPEARTVFDVVRQWEKGDPSNGLLALCQWVPAMRRKGIGNNAMTYSNRKTIYMAYRAVGGSFDAFFEKYGRDKTLTEYCTAVRACKVDS